MELLSAVRRPGGKGKGPQNRGSVFERVETWASTQVQACAGWAVV